MNVPEAVDGPGGVVAAGVLEAGEVAGGVVAQRRIAPAEVIDQRDPPQPVDCVGGGSR